MRHTAHTYRASIAVTTLLLALLSTWTALTSSAEQITSADTAFPNVNIKASMSVATPVVISGTTPTVVPLRKKVVVNGRIYDAYLKAAVKKKQEYHYSCEFDAAWVVLKTYGFDVGVDKQAEIIGVDKSREPYYKETKQGVIIYGGDVTTAFSGDYKKNFLARSTGTAMRKVFEHYELRVTPVNSRAGIEAALLRDELVWIKTTVDFKAWRPATWVMPDGRSYKTVLGNDHAVVVIGFNKTGVVIRDVLGPTSTNWQRRYEYEVTWTRFLAAWGAQQYDGLAVAPLERLGRHKAEGIDLEP